MRVGIIGRFQPLHLGHEQLLRHYANANLTIAIGSANKQDADNPLTYEERKELIEGLGLSAHVVPLNDYDDDGTWAERARTLFGSLDELVTGNELVKELLEDRYKIVRPEDVLGELPDASGTIIRDAIRNDLPWQHFVSDRVERYLSDRAIYERIRSWT